MGRETLLGQIEETLHRDHRAVIHDISGLGKTFTSYKFVNDNHRDYTKIFWVRATKEEMLESLAKCGELVNPKLADVTEQQVKALGFKQWLEENDNWLVIYDNVDLPNELFKYVPFNKSGDCLFTSNFEATLGLGTNVTIQKLDKTDAEILLFSRAMSTPYTRPDLEGTEKEAFDSLVTEIDGLPLTLNSSGALISRKKWTFNRFWQKYQATPDVVWESEDDFSTYQHGEHRSAGKVFSMAYNELIEAENTGEAVKTILDSVSFISPDDIPEDLLKEILKNQYDLFAEMPEREDFWDDVREKLTAYDLLKYDVKKEAFTTHRAIQGVIQSRLKGKEKAICADLSETFVKLFPEYDYSNREDCEKYYQHILTLLEIGEKLTVDNKNSSLLYSQLGRYQQQLGNFARAENFFLRAAEISAIFTGVDSADHAIDLNNLALIYRFRAKYDEAIDKYEQALRIDEKTIGKEHPDYATRLNNLANVYLHQGRYSDAIEKFEEAIRIDEKTIGKEHPDYAIDLGNLGKIYCRVGDQDKAESLQNTALSIFEKAVGKEHPLYAICLSDLALVYTSQGRFQEATEKLLESLQIGEKTLGKEHPEIATRLNNLADIYQLLGRYDAAVVKFEEALRIDEKTIGKEHPLYALRIGNLAVVYEKQGKYEQALDLYIEAVRIDEKTLPPDHPYTIQDREGVERCRKLINRPD